MTFWVPILSVIFAGLSALYARFAYKENVKAYRLNQTPILMPEIRVAGSETAIFVDNKHRSAFAKGLSLEIRGGKLSKKYSVEDEFITPGLKTKDLKTTEDIDGCHFTINYQNVFDDRVIICGTLHKISPGIFDIQDVEFNMSALK
jgi:hypothetical protein